MNFTDTDSLKNALIQLTKYASILQENLPSNQPPQGLNDAQRDELIQRAVLTQDAKLALAQAMCNPLKRKIERFSIFRTFHFWEVDIGFELVTSPVSNNFAPSFEQHSNPSVRVHPHKTRRMNAVEKAVAKARKEIEALEDRNVFASMDQAIDLDVTKYRFNIGKGISVKFADPYFNPETQKIENYLPYWKKK